MTKIKFILLGVLTIALISGCQSSETIVGKWRLRGNPQGIPVDQRPPIELTFTSEGTVEGYTPPAEMTKELQDVVEKYRTIDEFLYIYPATGGEHWYQFDVDEDLLTLKSTLYKHAYDRVSH